MFWRSPVAACTESESALSWTFSSRSRPSTRRSPKSEPAEPVPLTELLPVVGIVGATYGWNPPTASIPETLISAGPDLEGAAVGLLGVLGDLHRGLEATLRHDQLGHLGREVVLGSADVAVRVG